MSRRGQPWPRDLFWPCVPTPVVTNHPPSPRSIQQVGAPSTAWRSRPAGRAVDASVGRTQLCCASWHHLARAAGLGWQQGPIIWLPLLPGHSSRQGRGCALLGVWKVSHCVGVHPSQRGRGASLRHPVPPGAVALIRVPPAATGPAGLWGSSSQSQRAGNFLLPRRASHGGGSDFPARTSLPRPSTSHSGCLLGPRGRGVMAVGAPRPLPGL